MERKLILSVAVATTVIFSSIGVKSLYAEDNMTDLKKQIELLQKRVDELEDAKKSQKQTYPAVPRKKANYWDPFAEMEYMQQEMNRMFENSFGNQGWPGGGFSNQLSYDLDINLKENENEYEIKFDMTGLDKDKVNIEINDYTITVKGEHRKSDTEEGPNRYFSSQSYGSFMKTIPLPEDADSEQMKTERKGELLLITIPKKS